MIKLTKEHRDKIVSEIYSHNRKVMKRKLTFYNIDNNTEYSFPDLMIHFFGDNTTYYLQKLTKNNTKIFKKSRIIYYDIVKYLDKIVKTASCPLYCSINSDYPIGDNILLSDINNKVIFGIDKRDSHTLLNVGNIQNIFLDLRTQNNRVKTIRYEDFKSIFTYYTYVYFDMENLFQDHVNKQCGI